MAGSSRRDTFVGRGASTESSAAASRQERASAALKQVISRLGAAAARYWRGAAEGLLYTAAALVVIWPVTMHLTSWIVGVGDGEFYLWLGWRLAELVKSGSLPLVIPGALYPETYHVAWGDGYGAYLVIAFWDLFVNPYLAINLTVLTALMLNFLSARRLMRVVGPTRRTVWILGALAYGTAPQLLLRLYGHYHLLFAFVPPLVLAEAILYARQQRQLRVFRIGVLLAIAFYLSVYWFATSIAALAAFVLVVALRERALPGTVARLAGAVVVMLVLTAPMTIPRLQFQQRESAAAPPAPQNLQEIDNENNTFNFSADALSVITQPSASRISLPAAGRLHRNFYPNRIESTIFPGILLVLALVAAAFIRSRLRLPVLAAGLALWLLALGPTLFFDGKPVFEHANGAPVRFMPEELLYSVAGASALRTPNRLALALPAVATLAFAFAADWFCRRAPALRYQIPLGVASAALIATNLINIPYTPRALPRSFDAALHRIRTDSKTGDTVMEVPFDAAGQFIQTARFQLIHRRPMLGFHAQHSALPWFSDFTAYKHSKALAEVRCFPPLVGYAPAPYPPVLAPVSGVLSDLRRQFHVRFVLVNEQLLAESVCDERRRYIESILAHGRLIERDPAWRVVEVGLP
jgi:hypothetical protein